MVLPSELLAVMIIIGVLAAIAIPVSLNQRAKAIARVQVCSGSSRDHGVALNSEWQLMPGQNASRVSKGFGEPVATKAGRTALAKDAGFTLIELIMVMSIGAILATIASYSFVSWRNTAEHQGTAQEMVSQFRNTAELAISEGRTHCVDLDPSTRSYSIWRYACSSTTGTQVSGIRTTQSSRVTFMPTVAAVSPTPPCPASHSCLYFYPRGTAIPATITVSSSQRSKVYTIHVEGLTARVYL